MTTGRTHRPPNFQNVPIRTEEGRRIKESFIREQRSMRKTTDSIAREMTRTIYSHISAQTAYSRNINPMEVMAQQSPSGRGSKHLLWMLREISSPCSADTSKAHRWLGYAQALSVEYGFYTLEELRKLNEGLQ